MSEYLAELPKNFAGLFCVFNPFAFGGGIFLLTLFALFTLSVNIVGKFNV